MKKKGDDKQERRCKNCGSSLIYIRIKDKEKLCRQCGFIEKLEEKDGSRS